MTEITRYLVVLYKEDRFTLIHGELVVEVKGEGEETGSENIGGKTRDKDTQVDKIEGVYSLYYVINRGTRSEKSKLYYRRCK